MLTHTARSLLGRNHREINKEQQNLTTEEQGQHQATGSGLASLAKKAQQNQKKL
jgi:hypothetical protein